ncbi:hypothetical protein MKK88_03985 [Methylobacterium sp. E-005]|uniref:hypothetical protein n=1 Tax=Methylobacterium sp. E-005 TaxID=2836549 RepID=UPI001FB8C5C1|nr:hypothetical protein [Methylobacterium sp. E-005]MCJ2085154.1 hypothetical protein [Methylobacterium sp. E-005]
MDDDDDAENHETGNTLGRIARILDVPAASFFAPEPSPTSEGTGAAATAEELAQALAVMRLFLRLKSSQARARCVSFITQELVRDSPSIDLAPDD